MLIGCLLIVCCYSCLLIVFYLSAISLPIAANWLSIPKKRFTLNSLEWPPKFVHTVPCFSSEFGYRYRPKRVLRKGVGNNKNASEMRQKCVKNASKAAKMGLVSGGVRVRFRVRFQAVKVPIYGGFRVEPN